MFPRPSELWHHSIRTLQNLAQTVRDGLSWWFGGINELPRQLGAFAIALGEGIVWILRLPVRILAGLWEGLARTRNAGAALERSVDDFGKSVRATALDLREAVEAQPQSWRARWAARRRAVRVWYSGRLRWQRFALIGLGASIVLGLVGAYPAWVWFRGWRATQLLAEAESLFAEGRRAEAYYRGQAAYFTDPANPDILSRLIDFSRDVGSPSTLRFGAVLVNQGQASPRSLAALVDEAQARSRPELARAYLGELERLDPDHPAIPRLRIQGALAQRDRERAFMMAEAAVRDDPFSREVFLIYASLGLDSADPERTQAVREKLQELWMEPGEEGRLAALILLRGEDGATFEESGALIARILDDPEVERDERLFALAQALRLELRDFASIRSQVRGAFDLSRSEERIAYAAWLLSNGQFAEILSEYSVEAVNNDRVLLSIYLIALIESGRAAEGLELVRGSDAVVLPEFERIILEGRMLRALGREDAFTSTIERAIARCTEDQFRAAERLLQQLGEEKFLTQFYEKFARQPSTAVWSNANLLMVAYARRDDAALKTLMARSQIDLLGEIPVAQGLLAYLQGLSDESVPANIRAAEKLVAQYPTIIDFRVALTINYYRAGYLTDAVEVMKGIRGEELEKLPGMFATSQAVLRFIEREPFDPDMLLSESPMLDLERRFIKGLWHSSSGLAASLRDFENE